MMTDIFYDNMSLISPYNEKYSRQFCGENGDVYEIIRKSVVKPDTQWMTL